MLRLKIISVSSLNSIAELYSRADKPVIHWDLPDGWAKTLENWQSEPSLASIKVSEDKSNALNALVSIVTTFLSAPYTDPISQSDVRHLTHLMAHKTVGGDTGHLHPELGPSSGSDHMKTWYRNHNTCLTANGHLGNVREFVPLTKAWALTLKNAHFSEEELIAVEKFLDKTFELPPRDDVRIGIEPMGIDDRRMPGIRRPLQSGCSVKGCVAFTVGGSLVGGIIAVGVQTGSGVEPGNGIPVSPPTPPADSETLKSFRVSLDAWEKASVGTPMHDFYTNNLKFIDKYLALSPEIIARKFKPEFSIQLSAWKDFVTTVHEHGDLVGFAQNHRWNLPQAGIKFDFVTKDDEYPAYMFGSSQPYFKPPVPTQLVIGYGLSGADPLYIYRPVIMSMDGSADSREGAARLWQLVLSGLDRASYGSSFITDLSATQTFDSASVFNAQIYGTLLSTLKNQVDTFNQSLDSMTFPDGVQKTAVQDYMARLQQAIQTGTHLLETQSTDAASLSANFTQIASYSQRFPLAKELAERAAAHTLDNFHNPFQDTGRISSVLYPVNPSFYDVTRIDSGYFSSETQQPYVEARNLNTLWNFLTLPNPLGVSLSTPTLVSESVPESALAALPSSMMAGYSPQLGMTSAGYEPELERIIQSYKDVFSTSGTVIPQRGSSETLLDYFNRLFRPVFPSVDLGQGFSWSLKGSPAFTDLQQSLKTFDQLTDKDSVTAVANIHRRLMATLRYAQTELVQNFSDTVRIPGSEASIKLAKLSSLYTDHYFALQGLQAWVNETHRDWFPQGLSEHLQTVATPEPHDILQASHVSSVHEVTDLTDSHADHLQLEAAFGCCAVGLTSCLWMMFQSSRTSAERQAILGDIGTYQQSLNEVRIKMDEAAHKGKVFVPQLNSENPVEQFLAITQISAATGKSIDELLNFRYDGRDTWLSQTGLQKVTQAFSSFLPSFLQSAPSANANVQKNPLLGLEHWGSFGDLFKDFAPQSLQNRRAELLNLYKEHPKKAQFIIVLGMVYLGASVPAAAKLLMSWGIQSPLALAGASATARVATTVVNQALSKKLLAPAQQENQALAQQKRLLMQSIQTFATEHSDDPIALSATSQLQALIA